MFNRWCCIGVIRRRRHVFDHWSRRCIGDGRCRCHVLDHWRVVRRFRHLVVVDPRRANLHALVHTRWPAPSSLRLVHASTTIPFVSHADVQRSRVQPWRDHPLGFQRKSHTKSNTRAKTPGCPGRCSKFWAHVHDLRFGQAQVDSVAYCVAEIRTTTLHLAAVVRGGRGQCPLVESVEVISLRPLLWSWYNNEWSRAIAIALRSSSQIMECLWG